MKISIIGAGNVGGLTAMRLSEITAGDICLIDIAKGIAQGKVFDLEDTRAILKTNYNIKGCENIDEIADSNIIVITAGLARKPGMTREDLLNKNALILKDICGKIKTLAAGAIVVIVTNPLDLMTQFALQITGFKANRVFGMGVSLDAARFANLISKELRISPANIEPCVIGSHGEGMLPLSRFTTIKGISLDNLVTSDKIKELAQGTIDRGKEIVSLLGAGSAYFAPSAAIVEIVKAVIHDEKRILGVSAYLSGEYNIHGTCIGVPCVIGKNGIEKIINLELNEIENSDLQASALKLKEQYSNLAK